MSDVRPVQLLAALEHLTPGRKPVIVEAGAYDGSDTVELAKGAEHVHAFEPVPPVFRALIDGPAGKLRNVTHYAVALGLRDGKATMHVGTGPHMASSSLRQPTKHLEMFPSIRFRDLVSVRCCTLLSWAMDTGVQPTALWLDVQGCELDVLRGASNVLAGVQAMVLEASVEALYAGACTWEELRQFCEWAGFKVVIDLDEPHGDVLVCR